MHVIWELKEFLWESNLKTPINTKYWSLSIYNAIENENEFLSLGIINHVSYYSKVNFRRQLKYYKYYDFSE